MPRVLAAFLVFGAILAAQSTSDKIKQGHSHYGAAFDSGPRAQPWEMPDIGSAPFPITTQNAEVQKWFNQGNTLLHSFWDYEAERAFRWALKLEPENPMIYWGLARATSGSRSKDFLREAVKRKHKASDRERLYIEALEALNAHDPLRDRGDDQDRRDRDYRKVLETICVKYPADLEARALLALANMGDARYGTEMTIREVLAKAPDHPGAHHYRIHNWNYHEPEQALESCKRYGQIAPGAGHALHMPGHVYATVGMWYEAALSMDAATRAEKKYMRERLVFPFNHWNYGHNRNYLSYIQEQLGMAKAAAFGARQLIDAPLDPKNNGDNAYSSHSQGLRALARVLIKFEKWDELSRIPWRDIYMDKLWKTYVEARAHLGKSDLDRAQRSLESHDALKKDLDKNKQFQKLYEIQSKELRARIALAKGDTLAGLTLLAEAAQKQFDLQKVDNDPPAYPEVLFNALGRAYLEAKSPTLAAAAFDKALTLTRNDWIALAGLAESHHALGNRKEAEDAMARFLHLTARADIGIPRIERTQALDIPAKPRDASPAPQREYPTPALERYGPAVWEPFAAPQLSVTDASGKPVTLAGYRGRNVILVFYLGRECLHCMNQLSELNKRASDWSALDADILAVSGNPPADNAEALKTIKLEAVRILSDAKFENARRFRSYDDFEEMELHSTILIDKQGRIHWASTGGEPFTDMAFLKKQLERMQKPVLATD